MVNEKSNYYIVEKPTITSLTFSSNEVVTGGEVTITMSITQSPRFLHPVTYYPSEIYSGEVTE